MTRIVPILLLASGCFYTDPIEQRPSINITQLSSADVYRNDDVQLQAGANDPAGELVYFQWRVYLCTDATQPEISCDQAPHTTGLQSEDVVGESPAAFQFTVPAVRDDGGAPVQSLLVDLEGADALGATAKPIQQLIIPISDHAPDLTLRKDSRHGYVTGTPIDLFAKVGDVDDSPIGVLPLDWVVFSPPTQPTFTIDDLTVAQDPGDPDHLQFGKTFTPAGIGDWDIQVTATDELGAMDIEHLPITVVADHPPCLAQWAPIASTTPGQALPISVATLFQVLVVEDDLDPFPPVPSDPVLGVTSFAWSILPPGATVWQPLSGVTGNDVSLDPANYSPGDVVELRVQIEDRIGTAVNCPDGDLTCSVISDPTCIQRQTWQVELL